MDSKITGNLIAKIRKDRNMTQRNLADKLHVSDKTISKWERGQGCPDVSSLNNLAEALRVNVSEILSGEIIENENNGDNMKKVKFYVCPECGNVITSTKAMIANCCGKKLLELEVNKEVDERHTPVIEYVEDDLFVSMNHEMTKEHYISFFAYVTLDKLMIGKLYPEQNAEVRFKKMSRGIIYAYCNQHGLWEKRM